MNSLSKLAAVLIGIVALLHLAAPVLMGFTAEHLSLLIFAGVYAMLGVLVLKQTRWAMWLSFFLLLLDGIVVMAAYLGTSALPQWLNLLMWLASWTAALSLFVLLWRDHAPAVLATQDKP